jgi:hypothetical protein
MEQVGEIDQLHGIAVGDQPQVEILGVPAGPHAMEGRSFLPLGRRRKKGEINRLVRQHPDTFSIQELMGRGLHHIPERRETDDQDGK